MTHTPTRVTPSWPAGKGAFQALDSVGALPQVVTRALRLLYDSRLDAATVAQAIDCDPILAARLIGLANSAFYRGRRRLLTTREAIIRLGYRVTASRLLTVAVSDYLRDAVPVYGLSRGVLWKHSIATALAAEKVASATKVTRSDLAFLTGLLHDLGVLVLANFEEAAPGHALAWAANDRTLSERERAHFGLDHETAGSLLLDHWNLPGDFARVIRHHHSAGPELERDVAVLRVADWLCEQVGAGLAVGPPNLGVAATVICLTTKTKYLVREAPADLIERVIAFRRRSAPSSANVAALVPRREPED